jgi:hypothetical protein
MGRGRDFVLINNKYFMELIEWPHKYLKYSEVPQATTDK